MATLVLCSAPSNLGHVYILLEKRDSCYTCQPVCMNLQPVSHVLQWCQSSYVSRKCPKHKFRNYEQYCFIKIQVHVDERHIMNDHKKLVMNKFCQTALLPDGCVLLEAGWKVANTNWELTGHSQQLTKSTLHV